MQRVVRGLVEAVPGLAYSRLVSLSGQVRFPRPAVTPTGTTRGSNDAERGVGPSADALRYRLIDELIGIYPEHDWPMLGILVDIDNQRPGSLEESSRCCGVPCVKVPRKNDCPDV